MLIYRQYRVDNCCETLNSDSMVSYLLSTTWCKFVEKILNDDLTTVVKQSTATAQSPISYLLRTSCSTHSCLQNAIAISGQDRIYVLKLYVSPHYIETVLTLYWNFIETILTLYRNSWKRQPYNFILSFGPCIGNNVAMGNESTENWFPTIQTSLSNLASPPDPPQP